MRTDKKQVRSRVWTGSILAALVAAVAIFAVMLQMEKQVLAEYERGDIYVAARDIPKGVLITEENAGEYLRPEKIDVKLIPGNALHSPEQLADLVAGWNIDEGVLLTVGMFESLNEITSRMEEPVIAGFRAEDLYQVVGGVLRAGDRIHVYTVSETGVTGLVWENVFVESVFDSGGNMIAGGDKVSAAQRINVYLDAGDVERFYTELAGGTLRVVKVCE